MFHSFLALSRSRALPCSFLSVSVALHAMVIEWIIMVARKLAAALALSLGSIVIIILYLVNVLCTYK